uniref:Sensory neuron membrane protein 1 n=2 Tax=Meteorus pulchricornis TaxID=51522 RepID=A0A1S5VFW0_9HYME|nr:sensory neuron membrane protein 1 [Meteorus pulchricornis]
MKLFMKLGIAGGAMFAFGILIGFIIFPPFLKSQVKKQSSLKAGSELREMWTTLPFPLDFKVYLFNVTNPEEIAAGAKPIVKEVGPFFYDEYKNKVNLVDDEEDDTVEFSFQKTWYFNQAKSGPGLTEYTEIIFPHMLILGAVMTTLRTQPTMVGAVGKALDSVLHKPESVFMKTTPRELLWEGMLIDCTVKDGAGKALCKELRKDDSGLLKEGENYRIALFGHQNGTASRDRIKVKRGLKQILDVGVVQTFNNKTKLDTWVEKGNCNTLNGTDSTIFHPFLYDNEDIVSFSSDICRSVSARFQQKSSVGGIKTNRYTASLGDMSKDPEIKCLCPTEDTCLKKGLMDLFNCVKAPIVASLPHLYQVEKEYLSQVDGLHPNEHEHELFIEFEPFTGSPLSARNRLQFNMFIQNVTKFKLMKTFPSALMPLFWIEEGILLGDDILSQIKMVFTLMSVVSGMKWTMITLGLGLGGAAGGLFYKAQQNSQKLDITKIVTKSSQNGGEKQWPVNISTVQGATAQPHLDS